MMTKRFVLLLLALMAIVACGPMLEETEVTPTAGSTAPTEETAAASPSPGESEPAPSATASATAAPSATDTPGASATFEAAPLTTETPDNGDSEDLMTPTVDQSYRNLPQVTFAMNDLAQRLKVPYEAVQLLSVETKVWPDSSLGCPHPEMAYTQVQQDGLLIKLQAEGQIYPYHSGGTKDPFLCEQDISAATDDGKLTPVAPDEAAPTDKADS